MRKKDVSKPESSDMTTFEKQVRDRLQDLVGENRPFSWASDIGIDKGTFYRIWHDGTVPSTVNLRKIGMAGYSIDWLLLGRGEKHWTESETGYIKERPDAYTSATDMERFTKSAMALQTIAKGAGLDIPKAAVINLAGFIYKYNIDDPGIREIVSILKDFSG